MGESYTTEEEQEIWSSDPDQIVSNQSLSEMDQEKKEWSKNLKRRIVLSGIFGLIEGMAHKRGAR